MQKNEKLANDLKKLLIESDLIQDVRIYFNNKCYSSIRLENGDYEFELLKDIKPSYYFEYANDKSVSLSFEGELYHILNYGQQDLKFRIDFEKIFEDNNCFYEFGDAWNLTVYYN